MTDIRVDEPDKFFKKKADDGGRLYIGQEFAGEEVEIAVARVNKKGKKGEGGEDAE